MISVELAEHHVLGFKSVRALEHLDAFVAQRLYGRARRRLHGNVAQDLHEVVLNHIAHRADPVVKGSAAQNAELLRHGDLHAFNVLAIPDRLEKEVGEAEKDHVLNGVLPEIVVDAEDIVFIEDAVNFGVERPRGFDIVTEGLLDDHTRSLSAAGALEPLAHFPKERRRDREVVQRIFCRAECLADLREGRCVVVIAIDVAKAAKQVGKAFGVEAAVVCHAVLGSHLELFEIPAGLGYSDDRTSQLAALGQPLQGGKDLFVSQVSRGSKKYQGV